MRLRTVRNAAAVTMIVTAFVGPAGGALTPPERSQILKSLRPSQVATVETANGGLDSLPLLTLDLSLDLEARHVSGNARLDWRNSTGKPVTKLPVRLPSNGAAAKGPKVSWTALRVTMPGADAVPAVSEKQSTTIQIVSLPRPLAPGERVVLEGHLDGRLSAIAPGATDPMTASMSVLTGGTTKADGEQYGTFACGDGICTLTGFTPEVPTFMEGHFDTSEGSGIGDSTYSEPLNLLLTVVAKEKVTMAVSGIETSRTALPHHRQRTTFAMAAAREVGIVASEKFVVWSADTDDVHVRSISLEADESGGKKALSAATESIKTFSKAFGAYPWSFLDVAEAALVGGAGGVELPALALDGSGFYRPATGPLAGIGGGQLFTDVLDFITRHEVAHQWWHAQVGSHSQLHPYFDEPLAQWSALYSTKVNKGEAAAERAKAMQVAVNFQALPMLGLGDGKVARPAGAFTSPIEYAGIVYGKAPLFYDAAAKMFGEDKIVAGLHYLTEQQRFKRAVPDDIWSALVHAVGPKDAPLMQRLWRHWFEELHGNQDIGALDLTAFTGGMQIPAGLLDGLSGLDPASTGNIQIDPKTAAEAAKAMQQLMKEIQGNGPGDSRGVPDDDDPGE